MSAACARHVQDCVSLADGTILGTLPDWPAFTQFKLDLELETCTAYVVSQQRARAQGPASSTVVRVYRCAYGGKPSCEQRRRQAPTDGYTRVTGGRSRKCGCTARLVVRLAAAYAVQLGLHAPKAAAGEAAEDGECEEGDATKTGAEALDGQSAGQQQQQQQQAPAPSPAATAAAADGVSEQQATVAAGGVPAGTARADSGGGGAAACGSAPAGDGARALDTRVHLRFWPAHNDHQPARPHPPHTLSARPSQGQSQPWRYVSAARSARGSRCSNSSSSSPLI